MVNTELNEQDLQSLCAKAKNGELLHIKLKAIQDTLKAYKDYSRKTDAEKQQLLENNKELKKNIKELKVDNEVFHEALEVMSQTYKLPQNAVKQAIKYASNSLDRER
jgi:regulator of sigma D